MPLYLKGSLTSSVLPRDNEGSAILKSSSAHSALVPLSRLSFDITVMCSHQAATMEQWEYTGRAELGTLAGQQCLVTSECRAFLVEHRKRTQSLIAENIFKMQTTPSTQLHASISTSVS